MTRALAALYRAIYDGFPSRLPEPTAVAVGQTALRRLPLDAPSLFRRDDPRRRDGRWRAAARFADPGGHGLRRQDPEPGDGPRIRRRDGQVDHDGAAPRASAPNLVRRRSPASPGLVNCNGFANPGLEAFRASRLPHRVPLIVRVAGETADDYGTLVRALGPFGNLVEYNIPLAEHAARLRLERAPAQLRALLEAVQAVSPRPLIVNVSPDFADTNEADITPAALEAGVWIATDGNTRRSRTRRRTRRVFGDRLDLIATGGVDAPDKARALLDADATAISYFTGVITKGPSLARLILDALLASR